ncbi:hypothetical protein SAMN02745146_3064 [Hymenobacter daecheongensis DSM 21074]|uniref:Uncharacterized protein n=1 Tax=Hymenobacter daecheongensis DSM 21074 TaxID=1121955 RepID=A0A1M6J285_9BACT|nr:hypothetical protein [Hymenobacter daecheongensis]SHJ40798.1 hypothetical protein SAMN02745146_3064 [Hymenobacter daecheongensis DSM 21074]
MNNVDKVQLSDLASLYPDNIDLFICCASFETRCLSIAKALTPGRISKSLICFSEDPAGLGPKFKANKSILLQRFAASATEAPLRHNDPIATANTLVSRLSVLAKEEVRICVVDITTFTHEALLILLRVLTIVFHKSSCNITFVYAAAQEYSVGDPQSKKWLTRGVGTVRSVLGYGGEMNPAKGIHLVILMGFEQERARKLVELFEPAKVSLGIGRKATSVNESHYRINMFSFKNLAIRKEEVDKFNFSCTSPDQTRKDLRRHISKYTDYNTVIVTLNTKLSTIGAGLYCVESPQTQICYVPANLYNVKGYSSPDDSCYVYTLENFWNL